MGLRWEKMMIEADDKLFEGSTGRRGRRGRAAPQTRAELNAVMGEGIDDYSHAWDQEGVTAPLQVAELTIASLGNMAETATLPSTSV